jgi:hypothetical protein
MLKSSFLSLAAATTTAAALAATGAAAQTSDDGGSILTAYSGGAAPSRHQPPSPPPPPPPPTYSQPQPAYQPPPTHAYAPQPVNTVERPGWYVSGGPSWTHYNGHDGVNVDAWSFTGRLGWQINPWFAFEFEGTPGTSHEHYSFDGPERDIGIDVNNNGNLDDIISGRGRFGVNYLIGPYAKASFPFMNQFAVFGRLGWAFLDIDNHVTLPNGMVARNLRSDGSDDGVSFGAGAEWGLDVHSSFRLDYTYADISLAKPNQVALVYQYKF